MSTSPGLPDNLKHDYLTVEKAMTQKTNLSSKKRNNWKTDLRVKGVSQLHINTSDQRLESYRVASDSTS
jgi:hypothetical protein